MLLMMNLALYTTISTLASSVCLGAAYNSAQTLSGMLSYLLNSRMNILIMVNFAYNLLFLFGKVTQWIFFGPLRDVEAKNIYDRLLHYVLFKIVFISAILEPNGDLLIYIACFSILGFMKLFSLLARDRFEYITTFNPNASGRTHTKLLTLLSLILFFDLCWFYFCIAVFQEAGTGRVLLLTFECFTLLLDTIQTLMKYVIYLVDVSREGVWEERGNYIYYTEFITDSLILVATFAHYAQIFWWHGFQFTLIDMVLILHMRAVYVNLRDKLIAYSNYRRLQNDMKNRYPDIRGEELSQLDDVCAICHDKMESAKKLPCGHIFHHSCLRSWLEHHYNCPTCRYALIENAPANTANPGAQGNANREIFRFNGSRWLSFLPTIQVVSDRRHLNFFDPGNHMGITRNINTGRVPATALVPPEMIAKVQDVFPHIPASMIAEDLLRTQSVELTTENIIEGRITVPPNNTTDTSPPPSTSASTSTQSTPIPNNSRSSLTSSPSPNSSESLSPTKLTRSSSPLVNLQTSPTESLSNEPKKTNFSDDFAQNPQERHQRLLQRKKQMLEQARRQFLEKQRKDAEISDLPTSEDQFTRTVNNNNKDSISEQRASILTSTSSSSTSSSSPTFSSIGGTSMFPTTSTSTSTSQSSTKASLSSSSLSMELTPELRRRQLLEAAQKRLAKKDN